MTIPFLQVKPKSIKLKVSPRFPSQLLGRSGINVTKENGNYYLDLDYTDFPQISVLPPQTTYALIFDPAANHYVQAPISLLGGGGGGGGGGIADAPIDGYTYGRNAANWVRALSLSGGTMTGTLTLASPTPINPNDATTKYYVDLNAGIGEAPMDGAFYARRTAGWQPALGLSGGTMTGALNLAADPTSNNQAATKHYVDTLVPFTNVKAYGAIGDGVANDTTAIQNAIAAMPTHGMLYIPPGIYNYTTLNFDNAAGIRVEGNGAIAQTILRCIDTGTGGVKARSTFDCTFAYIHFDHASGFSGYLVDARHAPSIASDTQGLYFFRCTFASQGYSLYTANGVALDQATLVSFEGCKFGSLSHPIDGQLQAGGSYSNRVSFRNCQAFDNVGFFVNNPGEIWSFEDCNFQACHDGLQRLIFSANTVTWMGLSFRNCGVYDATAAGSSYLTLGPGKALHVVGGMIGGAKMFGSSSFLNATGAILGLYMGGAYLSNFTNVLVASVAGNKGWNYNNGNAFDSCTTLVVGSANITGLSGTDLNAVF